MGRVGEGNSSIFFLKKEIEKIKEYVPQALAGVQSLVIAVNGSGEPAAFMGIEDHRLEMLFLSQKERGKALENNCFYTGSRITG